MERGYDFPHSSLLPDAVREALPYDGDRAQRGRKIFRVGTVLGGVAGALALFSVADARRRHDRRREGGRRSP